MATAYASAVITAPVEEVWQLARDFDGLAGWHPGVASSEIEEGRRADQVGCVRKLGMAGGGQLRERLLALDDTAHSCTYEFVESPFPVRSYRSTLRLTPVTDSGHTFAEWWADFDADAADEPELSKTFGKGVFKTGLNALKERFAS